MQHSSVGGGGGGVIMKCTGVNHSASQEELNLGFHYSNHCLIKCIL